MLVYGYNGLGRRAWKQTLSQPNSRRYFLYDGDLPLAEINASGSVTLSTYGPNGLAATYFTGTGVLSRYETYYGFDPAGNVAVAVKVAGSTQVTTYLSDAFGKGGATAGPGFAGQWGGYADYETGLVLLGHRYYDPNTGRFLTRDPIGYAGGINLYAYCQNNPVNWVDPLGFCPTDTDGSDDDPLIREYTDGTFDWMHRVKHVAPKLHSAIEGMNSCGDGALGMGASGLTGFSEGSGGIGGFRGGPSEEGGIRNPILGKPRSGSGRKIDFEEPIRDGKNNIVREFPPTARAHGFPDIVDNFAGDATGTVRPDGAMLYQLEGSYNGVAGRFEWIDDGGVITHRMFVPGGTLSGVPIR